MYQPEYASFHMKLKLESMAVEEVKNSGVLSTEDEYAIVKAVQKHDEEILNAYHAKFVHGFCEKDKIIGTPDYRTALAEQEWRLITTLSRGYI